MTYANRTLSFERLINILQLLGVMLVLTLALADQLLLHELPCPLCLLQRIGFVAIAFGLLMNLRFGFRPLHYSIILISALFTSFVAMRQIVLHIVPGSGAYGSPIFGLHLYTWCYIITMIIVIVSSLLLSFESQYEKYRDDLRDTDKLTNLLFALMSLLIMMNVVSVVLECGWNECPDNPTNYTLIDTVVNENAGTKLE